MDPVDALLVAREAKHLMMKRNRKVWQYIYASLIDCYNLIVNNYQENALGVSDNSWL